MSTLLLLTILLPAAGALVAMLSGPQSRYVALATAVIAMVLATVLLAGFPGGTSDYALTDVPWLGDSGPVDIRLGLALDGVSLWLFGLTALLVVVSVLVSWEAISEHRAAFYSLLLALETGMLGVFAARDIVLFYVFFEFTLIPLFFLIGVWGSEERRYAAIKFFLFTLAGSVLTLLGLLAIVIWDYQHSSTGRLSFSIPQLTAGLAAHPMDFALQLGVFVALFAGFAIKVPLFPLHTWLPLAHVQAPTAGSVILAGVLLKIGTYGFLRFNLPMLPDASAAAMPVLLWLSVIGILYGAMVALAQEDIKKLIAYSSVSHLGFCMLGLFALNPVGVQGSVLQMVNHGLSTGGLFAVVGMLYERYHTRKIADLRGLASQTPVLAFFMLVLTLASIGMPGLNGFPGEFMILLGMFQRGWAEAPAEWAIQFRLIAVLATFGVVLGAWYMLQLVRRVFFGPLHTPEAHPLHPVRDLSAREVLALAPLVALIVWIGIQPNFFLARMAPGVDLASAAARDASHKAATVGPTTHKAATVGRAAATVEGSGFGDQVVSTFGDRAAVQGATGGCGFVSGFCRGREFPNPEPRTLNPLAEIAFHDPRDPLAASPGRFGP